jgi:DNA polymerase-3 subunit alpha (Gram-positive type)
VDEIRKKVIEIKRKKNSKTEIVKIKELDLIPVYELSLEMYARGYKMKLIDIEKSKATEFVIENDSLIPPFNSIDSLGEIVALSIIHARNEKPFSSKEDLMKRTKLNKTHL